MQRDSAVLFSHALLLTNRPQALHSQLLCAQALWSENVTTFSSVRDTCVLELIIYCKQLYSWILKDGSKDTESDMHEQYLS